MKNLQFVGEQWIETERPWVRVGEMGELEYSDHYVAPEPEDDDVIAYITVGYLFDESKSKYVNSPKQINNAPYNNNYFQGDLSELLEHSQFVGYRAELVENSGLGGIYTENGSMFSEGYREYYNNVGDNTWFGTYVVNDYGYLEVRTTEDIRQNFFTIAIKKEIIEN